MNGKQLGIVMVGLLLVMATFGSAALIYSPTYEDGKIAVVASFYPLAYLAEKIGGENVKVSTLVPYNAEVHSWQPSASDILKVDTADIFIYNGAGLEPWIENEVLAAINTGDKVVVDSTKGIHLEEHQADGHDHGFEDPHTWISPYLSRMQALSIYNAFVEMDLGNQSYYFERWSELDLLLQRMDQDYSNTLANRELNTIFVTHAAYGYLADRYGFEQESVIGISADEQPSPVTIANLADMMMAKGIYFVFLDPVFSNEYVLTLKSEVEGRTGVTVEVLDLYLITGPIAGMDYMEQMEANLNNLAVGLHAMG